MPAQGRVFCCCPRTQQRRIVAEAEAQWQTTTRFCRGQRTNTCGFAKLKPTLSGFKAVKLCTYMISIDQPRLLISPSREISNCGTTGLNCWSAGRVFSCPGLPKHRLERPELRPLPPRKKNLPCQFAKSALRYFHTSQEAGDKPCCKLRTWRMARSR